MARLKISHIFSILIYLTYIISGAYAVFGLLKYSLPYEVIRFIVGDKGINANAGEMIYPILSWILMLSMSIVLSLIIRKQGNVLICLACNITIFLCYILPLFLYTGQGTGQKILLSMNAVIFVFAFLFFAAYSLKLLLANRKLQ